MEDLDSGLDADVVIFSDSVVGRATVVEMVNKMPGLRGVERIDVFGECHRGLPRCASRSHPSQVHSYVKLAGLTD